MPKLKPLRPENRQVQENKHIDNSKRKGGSIQKGKAKRKSGENKFKDFYWIPILIVIFVFAFYSLKDKKDLSLTDYKLSDTVSISGNLSYKEKSGKVKIKYSDGSSFDGSLLKGKFNGKASLEFPEGDKVEGSFKDGKLQEGLMTLKSGVFWSTDGKNGWQENIQGSGN